MQLFWDYLGKIAPQAQLSAKPAKSFKAAPIPPDETIILSFYYFGKDEKIYRENLLEFTKQIH